MPASVAAGTDPRGTAARWRDGGGQLVTVAIVLALALAAGVVASRAPLPSALTSAASPVTFVFLGLVAAGAGVALAVSIVRSRTIAVVALVGAIWLNLSEVLVREWALPSLLQLLAIPFAIAAARAIRTAPGARALLHPLTAALVAFVLVSALSTIWAADVARADREAMERVTMLVAYMLAAPLAASRLRLRAALWTAVAAGALLASFAMLQSLTGDFANDFGGFARSKQAHVHGDVFEPRSSGPIGDPNFFAQMLLTLVPLALFLAWEERSRRLARLAFALAALVVAGTILTYSRGGALALGIVIALSLTTHRTRLRRPAALAAVLGFAAMLWLPTDFAGRVRTLAQFLPSESAPLDLDSSFEERRLLARTAWAIFVDHPVAGVGVGNYGENYDRYADRVGSAARLYNDPGDRRYAHSLYLELGAETGTVGLAAFAVAMLVALLSLERARRRTLAHDPLLAGVARALQIAIVGHLASSLFLHGEYQRPFWLLLAFAAATSAVASSQADPERGLSQP